MSVLHSPENAESKERVKWEAQNSAYGDGLRPYVFRPYPMCMHLAGPPSGGMGAITIIEHVEVKSDNESDTYRARGFRATPLEALQAYEDQQLEYAKLAAERNYDVKNKLSPNAAAEVALEESRVAGHMPAMPEVPIRRRRGRPAKASAN